MMWVGVAAGLRWSECASLTLRSLDLLNGTLTVPRSKTAAGRRKLAIPVWLVEELAALAGRRVDLVTKRGLKPWVRPEVLKDARVIYAA